VCEAMNKKQFMECLHAINPAITTQEVIYTVLFRTIYCVLYSKYSVLTVLKTER
jgi:hypothetical protein